MEIPLGPAPQLLCQFVHGRESGHTCLSPLTRWFRSRIFWRPDLPMCPRLLLCPISTGLKSAESSVSECVAESSHLPFKFQMKDQCTHSHTSGQVSYRLPL